MELFFERNKVFLFSINLHPSNTVLEMKQKIHKFTGVTVSNQTIFFKGKILHTDRDSHTLRQCKISNKSRLELYFSTSRLPYSRFLHNISQQAEQPPAPSSTSVKDIIYIEDSPEKNQDSSLMVPSCSLDELFGIQEGSISVQEPSMRNYNNNRQDFLQPSSTSNIFGDSPENKSFWPVTSEHRQDYLQREPPSTPNIFEDFLFGEDVPLSTDLFANIQSFGYTNTTQEQMINHQDLPVSQVVQTEKNSRIRDVINIPDSPENSSNKRAKKLLRVMVLSFPINENIPARKFPVEVDPSENVEVLRTELEKMEQRFQLLLPEGGYFFIHNATMLIEKQSFRWNRVDEGDIIAIFPGTVSDDHTNTPT